MTGIIGQSRTEIIHWHGFRNMRSKIGNITEQCAVAEKTIGRHCNDADVGISENGIVSDVQCLIVGHGHVQNHALEFASGKHCERII